MSPNLGVNISSLYALHTRFANSDYMKLPFSDYVTVFLDIVTSNLLLVMTTDTQPVTPPP